MQFFFSLGANADSCDCNFDKEGSASRKGPLLMLASHALHRDHMPEGGGTLRMHGGNAYA